MFDKSVQHRKEIESNQTSIINLYNFVNELDRRKLDSFAIDVYTTNLSSSRQWLLTREETPVVLNKSTHAAEVR
jgi:hypothetical protein